MARKDKLIVRLKSRPRDFTWDELTRLLASLGYEEAPTGRAGGLRYRFVHATAPLITLHKPHPANVLKLYAVDDVLRLLTEEALT